MAAALLLAAALAAPPETVRSAFPPPPEAKPVAGEGFGAWLGDLLLRGPEVPVRTFDGRTVPHRARVVELPLVSGDLQQCADSILRLRGEWLRSREEDVTFYATSGDPIPWSRWRKGERPRAPQNRVVWSRGSTRGNDDWSAYLAAVFTWAGTRSLVAYETVPAADPRPGDVIAEAGSPGHAVLVLNVATRGDETFILVGEGYMPAQDFHVELGPAAGWWPWADDGLALPHWPLPRDALRRWRS